ncbi:MAG: hypothetical protein EA351_14270 [Gemmatimonadales bacterium]|nr:MAG: hypothetical protein EA351_14270 [Gemmatimonadales bacterium]
MTPMLRKTLMVTLGLLVVGLIAAHPLEAQIPEGVEGTYIPHPEAEKATSRLLSPFCPGLMLEQCPAQESRILRDSLQMLALQGMNARELEEWMLANHGEEYRAVPKSSGTGLAAWVLPPFALLMGVGAVVLVLRRVLPSRDAESDATDGSSRASDGPDDPILTAEDEQRLREAIREIELAEDPAL